MAVSKFFYYKTTKKLLLIKARPARTRAELSPTDLERHLNQQWGLS